MAGEWFAIDVAIDEKVEVWEICELTELPIETVVYRLIKLWGWFQCHSEDGNARVTVQRFAKHVGGSVEFWQAVAAVGWLEINTTGLTLPGWEQRFSGAAKARQLGNKRVQKHRKKQTEKRDGNAEALPQESTEQEITKEKTILCASADPLPDPPTPKPRTNRILILWNDQDGWTGISEAIRQDLAKAFPAANLDIEMARAHQWLLSNPAQSKRKQWRRFLTNWLSRCQDRGGTRNQAAPTQPSNRRYFRSDFQKAMTDAEYKAAKQRPVAADLSTELAKNMSVKNA